MLKLCNGIGSDSNHAFDYQKNAIKIALKLHQHCNTQHSKNCDLLLYNANRMI